ncbi:peptidase M16 [Frateuria sp. Soil773]|uniref:M16 family metallopeptidase n=1 Tax=Frateuria sp. Soil773 TaxID=1736407 RepID=UPI0006FB74D0|nr:pitrilysin family protein [Frateuria sp. Soil773]KRE91340.1 peptidase M16 [Frateuria sp. Soil773]
MRALRTSVLLAGLCMAFAANAADTDTWKLPVAVKKLDNGLTVVVSEDRSSPTVGISMVYHVGMRLEPQNRTGFAHLFEHLMFEGTPDAPKGSFERVIQGGGGIFNGSTRADYTNYISSAPSSALAPILWMEADRMKSLDFSAKNLANQQNVVKEEIRVNVKNQPYGLFFWTDLNRLAFDKWANNHDGYGSFKDLDHATVADVKAFHDTYYQPANAVLGIAGDVTPEQAFALAQQYFGKLPSRALPQRPDVSEPLNAKPRHAEQTDTLAKVPALAIGWKMPARGSKDQVPMMVLSQLLVGDDASRFYQGLVKGRELLLNIQGGVNFPLGDGSDYAGPTLLGLFALYKPNAAPGQVLDAINQEIGKVASDGVDDATLARVKTKMLADWYGGLESFINRADTLAKLQTLWGDAGVANQVPGWIEAVTSDDLKRVARTYLTDANRSVIVRRPAAAAPAAKAPAK